MAFQFTLSRMFQLVAVGAVMCSLFATVWFPAAMLVLAFVDVMACIGFKSLGRPGTALLAALTSVLIVVTLLYKGIGFQSVRHLVAVAWPPLTAACILQVATILSWFFFDGSKRQPKSDD